MAKTKITKELEKDIWSAKNGTQVEIVPLCDGDITRKGTIKGYDRNGYSILYGSSGRPRYVDEERIKIIEGEISNGN